MRNMSLLPDKNYILGTYARDTHGSSLSPPPAGYRRVPISPFPDPIVHVRTRARTDMGSGPYTRAVYLV